MALDTGLIGTPQADEGQNPLVRDLFAQAGIMDAEPALHEDTAESLAASPGLSFGAGMKAAREFLGRSLQDVADQTKIRSAYIAAIEAMDLHLLPSRPFTLGYVRAYARALGIDEEAALARFRFEAPDPNEPLRNPVGVARVGDPRIGFLITAAALVIAAIVAWNIVQRAMKEQEPHAATEAIVPVADARSGPVVIGEALPPPQESTVPDPYVTPGLAGTVPGMPAVVETGPLRAPLEPRAFATRAAIYGAPAAQSQVVIQAQRSVSLVARGGDGKVYFAQQLKAGEAYRVPMLGGLLIDVSSPEAMEVYIGGALAGTLTQPVTPLSALPKAPPPPVAAAPVAMPTAPVPVAAQPAAAPVRPASPRPVVRRPTPAPAASRVPVRDPVPTAPPPAEAAPAPLY